MVTHLLAFQRREGESQGDTRGSWQPIILLVGLLAFLLIRRGGSRRCLMAGFFLVVDGGYILRTGRSDKLQAVADLFF
jgi:hypothetical protein